MDSQKLIISLYNDLVATSVKEMSTDEQKTELERLFQKYVDIPIIARAVLGKSWRNANTHQKAKFVNAFKNYVSIKYGRQFSEFRGTTLEIVKSRDTLTKLVCLCLQLLSFQGKNVSESCMASFRWKRSLKLIDLRVEEFPCYQLRGRSLDQD